MSEEVKSVLVRDWYIQIYPEGMLVILGTKMGDKDGAVWRSSPIVKRVSSRVVETLKGSRYVLQGDVNRLTTKLDPKAYPIDDELLKVFAHGFPAKWQRQVELFCARRKSEEKRKVEEGVSSCSIPSSAVEKTDSECSAMALSKSGKRSKVQVELFCARRKSEEKRKVEEGVSSCSIPSSAVEKTDSECSAMALSKSGKCSKVQVKLRHTPMATRSSKAKLQATHFASSSSSCESSELLNTSATAGGMSEPNSATEGSATPVNVDLLSEASSKTSSTPVPVDTSGSDSSRQVYRLRPHGRSAATRASGTDDDTGKLVSVDSTGTSGKEEGSISTSPATSASARTRGIMKHRNSASAAESVDLLDSSTYFAGVLSNLKRSSSGRLIKTPNANVHYDCDMKGNFIGVSPQFLSPKLELVNPGEEKRAAAKGKKKRKVPDQRKPKEKNGGETEVAENLETPSIKGKQRRKKSQQVSAKRPKVLLRKEAEVDPGKKTKKKDKNSQVTRSKVSSANRLLQNLRLGQLAKESTEENSDSSSNFTLVLAKPGTLKRSRQIQAAMKGRDAGYSADAFDEATPLKKKNRVQFHGLADISVEDDSDESDDQEENVSESGMESPVTTWRERLGAPLPTTPDLSVYDYDEPTTIRSADRKAAAQISYRIRKKPLRVKAAKTGVQGQQPKGKGKKFQSAVVKNLQVATRKMDTLMDADSDNSFEDSEFSDSSSEDEDVLNSLY